MDGKHTQKELADIIGLDKTTMVVTVDELERTGLAERLLAPDDRRARIVSVTAAGKRKVAEAEKVKERVQAEILGELSPQEGAGLLNALAKLVEGRLAEQADCTPSLRRRTPRA